jgi:hypothetical protein
MGEGVPTGRTPIRLMYDEDMAAPGYLRLPPLENIENIHRKPMGKIVRPGKTPILLMYDEPVAAQTPFHPSRMQPIGDEEGEMWGGGTKRRSTKKMVGGTTTPIIPPFLSPAAEPASPPRVIRAPPPPAAYAAPYSHEAMRRQLPVGTPAPGQSLEDFQDEMLGRQLQEQARPVFAASPYVSRYGLPPINARLRRPQTAFAAPPPFHENGIEGRALFQDDSTTPTEMEGGRQRRRATQKRGAVRRRFRGQRGGWPFSCTGSKCNAAVAPAPLTPEQMKYIQYKPGGMGRGWRCPLCDVISPVLEYTDRYVRGSRENNEDGYYAYTCPACQGEIPSREENIRIQEAEANVERLVGEEQVTAAAEDLRRQARELGVSEENIESNIRRIREEPDTRRIEDFLNNNQGGGGRRRGTKKRATKRKALRRTLHHLRGGWPSWLKNPLSGCMGGECDAAVAPALPEELIAPAEPQAEIILIRFNNQTYDIIQRLIELLQRSEVELKNIQITLISLCNTINNIFIICARNRNNELFKEFFATSKNIVSNLRFILQLLGLYESGRGISTNVERDVVVDENVMLISEEMRDALNVSLLREVILGGERMTLLSYIKNSSENTKLNEIPEIIQRIMRVLTIMGFGPRMTSSRPASPPPVSKPREAWGPDI